MRGKRGFCNAAIYFGVVFAAFFLLLFLTGRDRSWQVDGENGLLELDGADLTGQLAYIPSRVWLAYPDALYTPEELAAAPVPEPGAGEGQTATYKLTVDLPAGQVYGLAGASATFAMRIWIDGVEYDPVGWPGATREETVPATRYATYYFTAGEKPVEIVIQRAGFYHRDGGCLPWMLLGRQQQIGQYVAAMQMRINIIVGVMLMAGLLFFGMFLYFKGRRQFLWFSLACLMVFVRTLTVEYKLIMVLLPWIGWNAAIGLEYLSFIGLFVSLVLYLRHMFDGSLPKWLVYGALFAGAVYALVVVLARPLFYTRFIVPFQIGTGVTGLLILWFVIRRMVEAQQKPYPEQYLALAGIVVFIALGIPDIFLYQMGVPLPVNLTQIGMLVCVLANMLALVLSNARMEAALSKARQEQEAVGWLNRLKSEFLTDISHEMKTPLAVMAGFAQLSVKQLERGRSVDEVRPNLNMIAGEAGRLALMVGQFSQATSLREAYGEPVMTDIAALVRQVGGLYEPIAQKRGNGLRLYMEEPLPQMLAKPDLLTQVLLNLLANANRHTSGGEITVVVKRAGEHLAVAVKDTGPGFTQEMLELAFERGMAGEGGENGIGLAICRQIIQEHGGDIEVCNRPHGGANVTFTLPLGGGAW